MSDAMRYRSNAELSKARQRDPIRLYKAALCDRGLLDEQQDEQLSDEIYEEIDRAIHSASQGSHPAVEGRFDHVTSS
ncbi:MAG TPA: thiamine pyrophosphate-dependent enzyme [Tepidisphaeraceae bacterium]|jgi:TPP-dependent pyruvate/acetoin dehydrogenase alpha subunit|nr:thiamine pyrophosphate-dependent enzyme [Tepidisphaeraceae bacterium]